MKHRCSFVSVAALLAACGAAHAQIAGPSSSATPYLTAIPGGPAVNVFSIMTTGDSVNLGPDGVTPYRFVGVPDGIGAFDNNDGTMTLLVNHELVPTQGIARPVNGPGGLTSSNGGSFVSQWIVNKTPGANFLRAQNGQDLDTSVVTSTNGTGGGLTTFSRFCSADLAAQTAYYNPATGLGTQSRIFLNGEEAGGGGRAMAHVVSERTGYQLTKFDGLNGSWENFLANPAPQDTTLVMANSDGGNNRVYAYVGTKQNTGSVIDRAGLTNGSSYGIQVSVNGIDVASEGAGATVTVSNPLGNGFGNGSSIPNGTLSGRFRLTPGNTGTSFQRPEDGAWDPSHPNDYYFVTTDRLDTARDGGLAYSGTSTAANITGGTSTGGSANQAGRSRLWKMSYDSITNPTAGGSISAVLNGTEGQNMLDNICVVPGTDGHTRIIALEDVGNASHNGKVWLIDATTGSTQMVLQHDIMRFGDVGTLPTGLFTYDKESSGVIDARDTLGLGWFLIDVQDHQVLPGELAEGGQLIAFYLPSAIPAPGSAALLALGGAAFARRRRR